MAFQIVPGMKLPRSYFGTKLLMIEEISLLMMNMLGEWGFPELKDSPGIPQRAYTSSMHITTYIVW
jgi:hypothetical protein